MISFNFFMIGIIIVLGIVIYEEQNQKQNKIQNMRNEMARGMDKFINIVNGKGSVNTYTPNLYYIFKRPFNLDDYL